MKNDFNILIQYPELKLGEVININGEHRGL
jgi:hypothetical protein